MRGKVVLQTHCFRVHGITPAYAGKSSEMKIFKSQFQDHPRVCGEKAVSDFKEEKP